METFDPHMQKCTERDSQCSSLIRKPFPGNETLVMYMQSQEMSMVVLQDFVSPGCRERLQRRTVVGVDRRVWPRSPEETILTRFSTDFRVTQL